MHTQFRPPSRPCKSYPHAIYVRASLEEKAAIRVQAQTARVSVSRYLIHLAVEGCVPPSIEEREELRRFRFLLEMVSTNLNQIAHRLHLSRLRRATEPTPGEIKAIVQEVKIISRELRRRLAR